MITERLLTRPIYGGVFGRGRYSLATIPCISHGLHSIRYMVMEPAAGAVLSMAENKIEALAGARRVLGAAADRIPQQLELALPEPEQPRVPSGTDSPPGGTVSRRRREVFDKSKGRCHYCGDDLQLQGQWHVEHMLPRALGGGDDPLNLVAACVGCNLAKSDRTAIEFVADGGTAWTWLPDRQAMIHRATAQA